jgi:hypothetical protein
MVFLFIDIDNTIKLDVVKAMAIVALSIIIYRIGKRYVIPDFKLMFGFASTRWNERLKGHFKGAYKYHNYYLTENSLKTDENSKELASIIHEGYVNPWFAEYYCQLSEDRLPLNMFINWTRSIVEDLLASVNPINHVYGWNNYLHNMDSFSVLLKPNAIELEDFEVAYLWGGVYYWLKCFVSGYNNEELLRRIEEVACQKKYLTPYFMLLKNLANGIEFSYSIDFVKPETISKEKNITSEQTALLWLAIAKQSEGDVRNKKNLAPVIHKITGVGEKSLSLKLCGSFKDEDKKALVDIIGEQMPNLADKILHIEKSNPLP